jgi:DNA (cytosine-5)-methyltransferase 1
MIALDLFCCAGGAAVGLNRAGYQVVGIDIDPQPRYPFPFIRADVMQIDFRKFDLIWASPPCQRFCRLKTREDMSGYPDLIEPVRAKLISSGALYVIENVPEAPIRANLMLCANMFGLRAYRHRHFECNFPIEQPAHHEHKVRVNRRGENRREHWANGGFMTITGDVGVYCGPGAMGIDWMTGNEMSEAIPPAYAEYIAKFAMAAQARRVFEAAE